MLTKKHLTDVCLYGGAGSQQCRYLVCNDPAKQEFVCAKKAQSSKDQIDQATNKFIAKAQSQGQDPYNMGRPLGNNCKGYISLPTVPQGYDLDGGATL